MNTTDTKVLDNTRARTRRVNCHTSPIQMVYEESLVFFFVFFSVQNIGPFWVRHTLFVNIMAYHHGNLVTNMVNKL